MVAGDPRSLFPHLRDTRYTGVLEVVNRDAVNYLVLRDGLIEQTYVTDDIAGHPRAKPDIGAQQFSTEMALRRPLTAADVGPNAP